MSKFRKIWMRLFGKRFWIIKGNKEIMEIIVSGHKIYLVK